MGVDVKDAVKLVDGRTTTARCSRRCCSRRSCRTARSSACSTRGDGWLRERFTELGVIQFEDWVDTGEEYALLDEVAKDRADAAA